MANQVHTYKDRDIKRVIKAVRSAGLEPTGVELDLAARKIKVTVSSKSDKSNEGADLDQWMKTHADSSQGH